MWTNATVNYSIYVTCAQVIRNLKKYIYYIQLFYFFFVPAIYLVFILTLGAMSVPLTIFVLSLHFRPKDEVIPNWLVKLNSRVLLKMACKKNCSKCCKRKNETEIELFDKTIKQNLQMNDKKQFPMPMIDAAEKNDQDLTWKILSNTMDKVFFNIYIAIIVTITIMLFLAVFVNYYISWTADLSNDTNWIMHSFLRQLQLYWGLIIDVQFWLTHICLCSKRSRCCHNSMSEMFIMLKSLLLIRIIWHL